MGNTKSKKTLKEPDKFFERERWKEQIRIEKRKKKLDTEKRRLAAKEPALTATTIPPPSGAAPSPVPLTNVQSFDEVTLDLMRFQLRNDADAFLLNNILLSVQFFENYERDVEHIKTNPISEREHMINEVMVRHNKHVFLADRLQECVNEHVGYQKTLQSQVEALITPRLFVIYDNVEASEPGDTSDYSAVLDAPFYKLRIEDCKEPGYVTLKKLEVLESTLLKENDPIDLNKIDSDDSVYADSEKESNDSDDGLYPTKGEALLHKLKNKIKAPVSHHNFNNNNVNINSNDDDSTEHNEKINSEQTKRVNIQATKSSILKIKDFKKSNTILPEEELNKDDIHKTDNSHDTEDRNFEKSRKSILKNTRRLSGPTKDYKYKSPQVEIKPLYVESTIAEDTETSGYRSNSSSRQTEMSESESDYGYATITKAATPKKVELSSLSNNPLSSGVLPDETWSSVQVRAIDWSDDDDVEVDNSNSKSPISKKLYDTNYYLSSVGFMNNFVDNFIMKLGLVLGFSQDSVRGSMTQGASIYSDVTRNSLKTGNEVFPALIAAWPNAANQWIIRERKIIRNPRTNFSYQWPTKYMVNKTMGFGCLLVPIGFRPKRGINVNQKLQWKIIFPAVERYLESCLAHAHMRCYLFALVLQKTFLQNETSKLGIDASHLKNHLFWQCENNYAQWPEHRLGESLRLFLRSFYVQFGQGRFPNYFIENCNDFKTIPQPLLLKLQRNLANILEAPVMHVLNAINKLKYNKKEFYPAFNVQRLYEILTTKNVLRLINPNLYFPISNNNDEKSDNEADTEKKSIWSKVGKNDKDYHWKKKKQRQIQEKRKAQLVNRKMMSIKIEQEIKANIMLPTKIEAERRRLVLEFFIPHFIAMARSSEKFDAIRQAIIYLEQAQRLCVLLKEEPSGETISNDYLDVIRDKLVDCQRKLVTQVGYKLPPRRESNADRMSKPVPRFRPRYENITSQDSPTDVPGFSAFTFVDIHAENCPSQDGIKLNDFEIDEDSKL